MASAAVGPAITQTAYSSTPLQVDVYNAKPFSIQYNNSISLLSSPTAFTLLHNAHEGVLVDAPARDFDAEHIAEWITSIIPDKSLKYIYITHGHVDHFGAFPIIQKRHPNAKVVATSGVIKHMKQQLLPETWNFWLSVIPNLTKPSLDGIVSLDSDGHLSLGSPQELRAVSIGEADTADSTVLWVPSVDLAVAGDVTYGLCHQYLAENPTPELRAQWRASIGR